MILALLADCETLGRSINQEGRLKGEGRGGEGKKGKRTLTQDAQLGDCVQPCALMKGRPVSNSGGLESESCERENNEKRKNRLTTKEREVAMGWETTSGHLVT